MSKRARFWRSQALEGYLCILPWLVSFVCFTALPMVGSLAVSLTNWSLLSPPQWIGFGNYRQLLADPLFYTTVYNTAYITFFSLPLRLTLALLLALGLNQKLRGVNVYRTICFLPSQMPVVASALIWLWVLNPDFGLANVLLTFLGLPPLKWLFDVNLAKPSIVLISLWGGTGTAMIIFLAGLQGVPESLYEAASIDGAGRWTRFVAVTLPMISPVIFFN